jgi:succinate dehydrogenase / fumarate reductase cytochrome b subunit
MSSSIDNCHFVLRRLHSLLGLVPVGAFLVFHLWANSQSRLGSEHYNRDVVGALQQVNYLPLIEILLVLLPLAFHALYGLAIIRSGRAEPLRYPYLRNRRYWLQRISGVGVLAFLLVHLWLTRVQTLLDPVVRDDLYGHMQALLTQPWMLALYFVGLLLAVFHLSNGLWSAAIVWGLTTSPRAQALSGWLSAGIGMLLLALGLHGLMGFLP